MEMTSQQPQPEWMEKLRHMLGAGPEKRKRDFGYRNYYCATVGAADHKLLVEMMWAGLVTRGRRINSGVLEYFHATEKGCKAIGLHKAAIKRALRDT